MSAPDLLKEYGPALAWFVPAIGWMVANHQANARELRKEVRDEVGEVRELIEDILSLLNDYPKSVAGSAEALKLESGIKFRLEDVSLRIKRLEGIKRWNRRPKLNLDDAKRDLSKFYDAVTGADFESATRQDEAAASKHHRLCAHDGLMFLDRLTRAYTSGFVE